MTTARQSFERMALPELERMHRFALRLTKNPAEAEDVVQDAMVRAYRFWDRFEQGTNLRAWLLTIVRNTFITRYNKQKRQRVLHTEVEQQHKGELPAAPQGRLSSSADDPEDAAHQSARRAVIMQALDSLPEDYRTAIVLADLEGLAYREVAEIMECPVGTVMSRIYRGRRKLHRLLLGVAVDEGLAKPGQKNHRSSTAPNPQVPSLIDYRKQRSGQ